MPCLTRVTAPEPGRHARGLRSALVWPVRGQLALFEGGLGHGVLGTPPRGRRATLLVNWWDHQPQVLRALSIWAMRALCFYMR